MPRAVLLIGVLFMANSGVPAAPDEHPVDIPRKPAWEWTLEERVAARFEPAARRVRVEQHIQRSQNVSDEMASSDSIKGSDNPELLTPTEVLGTFVRAAYSFDDRVAQNFLNDAREKSRQFGMPTDFMDVMKKEVAETAEWERKAREIRARLTQGAGNETDILLSDLEAAETEACRTRAAALAALRKRFPDFDRYLYSSIAPGVFYTFSDSTTIERLRREEDGCP